MHHLEPYFNWRNLYISSEDAYSPFFGKEYSEFEFTDVIYDHFIHPQWDNIGSPTLFIKVIYADYEEGFAIIEMIGEWNDCLYNDIMTLKRDIMDVLIDNGINKFILIGENVLNFHYSDDCYYEEWFEDVEDGWIACINFQEHVLAEMQHYNIDQYFLTGGKLNNFPWRTFRPLQLFQKIQQVINYRIGTSPTEEETPV